MNNIPKTARLAWAVLLAAVAAASAAEWRRDSLRQSVAEVADMGEAWSIAVSFLSVTSFDDAKNLLENELMARNLAEWGLWKEMGGNSGQDLEVPGMEKMAFSPDSQRVRAVFRVPKDGCRLVPRPVEEAEQGEYPLPPWPDTVADAKINGREMEKYLREHPFLLETGGAKIVRRADGKLLVISIGMIDADKPPLPRRKMAENRARTALVALGNQVRVYKFASHSEKAVVGVSEGGVEQGDLFEESTERIESEVAGWLPGLPVAGTWILKEDNLFCLAIGELLTEEDARRFFPSFVISGKE